MIEIVRTEAFRVSGIVIRRGNEAWLTFGARWWELRRWLWWWLSPGPKVWIVVNSRARGKVRTRATRIASSWVNDGKAP